MSAHSFDPDIAARVGCNAAVIYQNLFYWAEKNAAKILFYKSRNSVIGERAGNAEST